VKASNTIASSQLEQIAGRANVHPAPHECAKYAVDGMVPAAVVRPETAEQAAEIVRYAGTERLSLIPCGALTKLGVGMPASRYDIAMDMTRLNSVVHYDPDDLTLSVEAGMGLAKLGQILAKKNQFLPLMPPFFENCTVGGTIASGADSLLRPGYGTPRDFLIGAEFINGSGALNKSGGRVVKNVSGYDLHKLLIGSLGTLAVITRLNFRTFPLPEAKRGFLAAFDNEQEAVSLRQKIIASPLTPVVLEICSPEATRILFGTETPIASLLAGERSWHLFAGFEGTPEVCDRYARELQRLAQESGAHDALVLREAQYTGLAERMREAVPLLSRNSPQAVLFRFSGLPAETTTLLRALRSFVASSWIPSVQIVRGSSELCLALLPKGQEESLFKQVAYFWKSVESLRGKLDFRASILSCPSEWKTELRVWGADGPDLALMRRLKSSFDPHNLFAPGRFVGGI